MSRLLSSGVGSAFIAGSDVQLDGTFVWVGGHFSFHFSLVSQSVLPHIHISHKNEIS